ncbi:hypothetical protein HDR60_03365 [bacterium]|nr:hypothetical protein [bacterium]
MVKNNIKEFYKNNNVNDKKLTDLIKYNQDNKIPVDLKDERKIDLVYLWCDGHDKNFKEKKNYWLKQYGKLNIQSSTNARWRDNDELLYSLRSVEKFIPWINHIYIVTDNQVPHWLDTKHPKITIVDVKDIIPAKYLPTFNSNVIEAHLPYIKDLSEYFLYSNDDCFVNDYLEPSYFFTSDGKPIVNVKNSKFKKKNTSIYIKNLYDINCKINEKFNTNYSIEDSHNILPYRKSFLLDNLNDDFCREWFEITFNNKFREVSDLQRFIHVLLDNVKRRNKLRIYHKYKRDIPFIRQIFNWICHIYHYEFMYCSKHTEKILKYNPKLFCINDSENLSDKARERNRQFLKQYFNVKSGFEK